MTSEVPCRICSRRCSRHSVRLTDELLKKGKGELFEFMTYPGEFHSFTRAHVLQDAWTRVDRFFRRHLIEFGGAVDAN